MNDDERDDDPNTPPRQVMDWAQQRSTARASSDWTTADALKARIEAAGWKVVDHGIDFLLDPARPSDVSLDGSNLIGSPDSVASRKEEPDAAAASVIVITSGRDPSAAAAVAAIDRTRSDDVEIIVVADRMVTVPEAGAQLIRTAGVFTPGAALEAALRRAIGSVIVVLAPDRLATGDIVGPLTQALAQRDIAIVGSDGLASADLRRYHAAGLGSVAALEWGCLAVRRTDALAREPMDERLYLRDSVAIWWSLVMREGDEPEQPRRALAVRLPLERDGTADGESDTDGDPAANREARRDGYRIARRFARSARLAVDPES